MKRSRINPRSQKTIDAAPFHDIVRAEVFARDGHQCRLGGWGTGHYCSPNLSVHHLLKSSACGRYEQRNLLTLCIRCNSWVEDHPVTAHDLGLVCRRGDTLLECWERLVAAALVPRIPEGV